MQVKVDGVHIAGLGLQNDGPPVFPEGLLFRNLHQRMAEPLLPERGVDPQFGDQQPVRPDFGTGFDGGDKPAGLQYAPGAGFRIIFGIQPVGTVVLLRSMGDGTAEFLFPDREGETGFLPVDRHVVVLLRRISDRQHRALPLFFRQVDDPVFLLHPVSVQLLPASSTAVR